MATKPYRVTPRTAIAFGWGVAQPGDLVDLDADGPETARLLETGSIVPARKPATAPAKSGRSQQ
jgi:hypothetical protein